MKRQSKTQDLYTTSSYPAACQKAGGVGTCYDCRIRGQTAKLWFDEKRWWVALKPER